MCQAERTNHTPTCSCPTQAACTCSTWRRLPFGVRRSRNSYGKFSKAASGLVVSKRHQKCGLLRSRAVGRGRKWAAALRENSSGPGVSWLKVDILNWGATVPKGIKIGSWRTKGLSHYNGLQPPKSHNLHHSVLWICSLRLHGKKGAIWQGGSLRKLFRGCE